ncbi:unnamed protein product [Heligmosomoides polygyrus]|uniref:WD_REPEATS_REGION domain-containing protein n=1 Tax=Heligmosomoides polygyrus TaxID=6339 RepID=A0A3P7XKS3_HELPZ|nr:unnamed protein product [Heligmosomoides polygyrus]
MFRCDQNSRRDSNPPPPLLLPRRECFTPLHHWHCLSIHDRSAGCAGSSSFDRNKTSHKETKSLRRENGIFGARPFHFYLVIKNAVLSLVPGSSIERLYGSLNAWPILCWEIFEETAFSSGYRGKDVRNNVHYLPTGELLYFSGSVVILHNLTEHYQRHYTGHTSDVKCICVHPNRVLVASGQTTCHQRERRPEFDRHDPVASPSELENELENSHTEAHVRIWDSITLTTLHVLAMFEKALATVAFSNTDGGNLLACIDESYQHTLSIWRWSSETKLAEAKGANDQTFSSSWHPTIKNLIVVCGRGHFSFWSFDPKLGTLTKNSAVFDEGKDKQKTVLSMCFTAAGDVITGDSTGTLSLWDPTTFRSKKQAHAVHPGGVFALCLSRKGTVLSAGKDRAIAEWETTDLVRRRQPMELPDDAGTPRVILNPDGNRIVVGTSRNALFEGDFETDFEEIGDSEDVTCCAAVQSHLFVTCSADGCVRQYNTSTKKREWRKNFGGISCASVDAQGSLLALGFCGGTWSAVDLSSRDTVFEQKESTQPITSLAFASNGLLLFVATKELAAIIYRLDSSHRQFHRISRIGSLSSYVISADWDVSSQYIRGNSTVGACCLGTAANGELVDHASIRDLEWASCNCRISYEAGCVAHSFRSGITSVSRSNSKDSLVVGRDNGSLRLYCCPVKSTSVSRYHIHRSYRFLQFQSPTVSTFNGVPYSSL